MQQGALGTREVEENLLSYVEQGALPDVYNGVEDWLYDFWPNLTWGNATADIKAILQHPKFEAVQEFFMRVYKYDFRTMLENALEQEASY